MMEVELLIVNGDINEFMAGNIEVDLWGMGFDNLTVSETEEFNEYLSKIISLLRVGSIRKIRESDGEE